MVCAVCRQTDEKVNGCKGEREREWYWVVDGIVLSWRLHGIYIFDQHLHLYLSDLLKIWERECDREKKEKMALGCYLYTCEHLDWAM